MLSVERILETADKVKKIGIALTVLADELELLVAALAARPKLTLVGVDEPLHIRDSPSPTVGIEPPEKGD